MPSKTRTGPYHQAELAQDCPPSNQRAPLPASKTRLPKSIAAELCCQLSPTAQPAARSRFPDPIALRALVSIGPLATALRCLAPENGGYYIYPGLFPIIHFSSEQIPHSPEEHPKQILKQILKQINIPP